MDGEYLISRQEAAGVLGISTKTLHRLPVPYVRIGRRVLYRRADLMQYIESKTVIPRDKMVQPPPLSAMYRTRKVKLAARGEASGFNAWLAEEKARVAAESALAKTNA